MSYLILIAGVALWALAHSFKRIAPQKWASLGDPGKGLMTLLLVASIVLMVIGYRGAEVIDLWYPPAFLTHLNNLLMLIAVYLFAVSGMKTRLARVIRHPMLTGFKTWAFAHLLVNGDLASVILFGGLLAWAVISMITINRADRNWDRPAVAPVGKEIGALIGAVIVLGAIGFVHSWLGYWPYG